MALKNEYCLYGVLSSKVVSALVYHGDISGLSPARNILVIHLMRLPTEKMVPGLRSFFDASSHY